MSEENVIIDKSKNNALALFEYLKDSSLLWVKNITNIENYDWSYYFKNIPDDSENIFISYRDRVKTNEYEENKF